MSPLLSAVIICHNDQDILSGTLRTVMNHLATREYESEIIVSDGSSDDESRARTRSVVEDVASGDPSIRYVRSSIGTQKGAVVTAGMLAATGEYRLFLDSDNATPVEQVDALLGAVRGSDVAIASRYLPDSKITPRRPLLRTVVSRGGNIWVGWLLGLRFKDTRCGFKLFSARAAEEIFSRVTLPGFGFDDEALVIARELGLKVLEFPVEWVDRERLDGHPSQVKPADILSSFSEVMTIRKLERSGAYADGDHPASLLSRSALSRSAE